MGGVLMSATPLMTPEGFRTAAYLEARARLDARRKTKSVNCNPHNVRCGNRCIPPTWDCRLKGQGTDPHLRAVKTDPLGGLANIERGTKRLIKGVVKGSPSEIQGGKQAIIRGAVKISPGNIEQKKELRAKLERQTYTVGIGLLVVGTGFGLHNILMKANTFGYRNGAGRDINNAVRNGVNQVLDAVPVLGAQRRRTRTAVAGANTEAAYREAFNRVAGPNRLRETLGTGGEQALRRTPLTSSLLDVHSDLQRSVRGANQNFARGTDVYAWDSAHRQAFWTASTGARDLGASTSQINVFARPAAEDYLARQFGLTAAPTTSALKAAIQNRIAEENLNLISLAKQRGYRTFGGRSSREYIHADDFQSFVRDVVGAAGITSTPIRQGLEDHVTAVLREAPSTYTNRLYRNSVVGFSDFYNSVGSTFTGAGTPSFNNRLSPTTQNIQRQADLLRASFLARQMNRPPEVAGPAHADLLKRVYFATYVAGTRRSTYTTTNNAAISAARELTGRTDVIGPQEAFRILREEFQFTGLVPPRDTRRRGDAASPEVVRSAAYLRTKDQMQNKGKPCGESHIPKDHKCGKPNAFKTVAKVALAAGAVAGTAYALKRAKLGEFRTGIATGDFNGPVRKRRFAYEAKNAAAHTSNDFVDAVEGLKGKVGVNDANVQALQDFIKQHNIHSNPATVFDDIDKGLDAYSSQLTGKDREAALKQIKFMAHIGMMDGFASPVSDNIYVRSARMKATSKMSADSNSVTESVRQFMDHKRDFKMPDEMPDSITEDMKRLMIISRNTRKGDVFETINMIHEVSHKVHFKASANSGLTPDMMMGGNLYQPPKRQGITDSLLESELRRAASLYGQTDVDGRRAETFAELSVLYIVQGKRFKKEHPIAYDWVDQIWSKANA
jgi:hypothetical protein